MMSNEEQGKSLNAEGRSEDFRLLTWVAIVEIEK
jgi:hypothetical protein